MIARVALCCAAIALSSKGRADEPLLAHAALITPETQTAIDRGLGFLAKRQREDGSFGETGNGRNVAVVGLAGMAYLAQGSTPGRGEYGENINRCIDFLLRNTADSGLIASPEGSARGPMYGHGFALLFLCEVHGMAAQPALRDGISRGVELVIASQNPEGGWRYNPLPRDADVSVTVCQVMALRAARNAGIAVPRETMDRSIAYVRKCQNADGGFRYMLAEGPPESGFGRTAAGVVALYNAGVSEGPEISAGLEYLSRRIPTKETGEDEAYYFYGHYYAAQAMWHAGGERWAAWYPAIREELLARQLEGGEWADPVSPEYGTAMACIILHTPNNYLPILQR